MKKFLFVAMAIVMTIGFCSCNKDDDFNSADLVGDWINNPDAGWHKVYTTDAVSPDQVDGKEDYRWGYEYGQYGETDLEEVMDDRHGNGWFMWQLSGNHLVEYNAMNISSGVAPKEYTITTLTATSLNYKEATNNKQPRSWTFTKVQQ